ncbi:MAG TPA: hypothetical protein PLJ31_05920, partial [Armatimonadota bacterium]|nr:hypothetical protein [Armatimonadota bacterium]
TSRHRRASSAATFRDRVARNIRSGTPGVFTGCSARWRRLVKARRRDSAFLRPFLFAAIPAIRSP